MSLKIEIPDSQLPNLKEYYTERYKSLLLRFEPLIKEWVELEPILKQLNIVTATIPQNDLFKYNSVIKRESTILGKGKVVLPQATTNGYDSKWSWKQKAAYVIGNYGVITSKRLAEIIKEKFEPDLKENLATNSIPATLSAAAAEGVFTRTKNENGEYEYDLTKK